MYSSDTTSASPGSEASRDRGTFRKPNQKENQSTYAIQFGIILLGLLVFSVEVQLLYNTLPWFYTDVHFYTMLRLP